MLKFCVFNYVYVSISQNQWTTTLIIGCLKYKFCQTYVLWFPIKDRAIFECFRARKDNPVSEYISEKNTANMYNM